MTAQIKSDQWEWVDMDASSMIRIPSGTFWMGSDDHGKHERPRHRVFTDAYEIAAATVRRWEYALFMERTGHEEPRGWFEPAFADPNQPVVGVNWFEPAFADPNQPVVGVNWFDATAYCSWLSRSGGPEYRLPTEAEWEKACKGGDDTAIYSWGEQAPGDIAYYQGEWTAPRPSGERGPNGYGLYNMGDNVHEWCRDWYSADYYRISDRRNPEGPPRASGASRGAVPGGTPSKRPGPLTAAAFRPISDTRITASGSSAIRTEFSRSRAIFLRESSVAPCSAIL